MPRSDPRCTSGRGRNQIPDAQVAKWGVRSQMHEWPSEESDPTCTSGQVRNQFPNAQVAK
eukprot:1161635-Pelagomonas_calceolata.AAC.22